jgi:hypothetical protein
MKNEEFLFLLICYNKRIAINNLKVFGCKEAIAQINKKLTF